MDLATLGYIVVLMLGMLGVDAAIHPQDIVLTSETVGSFEKIKINTGLVDDVITRACESPVTTIDRLTLMRSDLRPDGARYEVVEALELTTNAAE